MPSYRDSRFVIWVWDRARIVYCAQGTTVAALTTDLNPDLAERFITADEAKNVLASNPLLRSKAQQHEAGVADIGLPYVASVSP
jgi:hypothetical protein